MLVGISGFSYKVKSSFCFQKAPVEVGVLSSLTTIIDDCTSFLIWKNPGEIVIRLVNSSDLVWIQTFLTVFLLRFESIFTLFISFRLFSNYVFTPLQVTVKTCLRLLVRISPSSVCVRDLMPVVVVAYHRYELLMNLIYMTTRYTINCFISWDSGIFLRSLSHTLFLFSITFLC